MFKSVDFSGKKAKPELLICSGITSFSSHFYSFYIGSFPIPLLSLFPKMSLRKLSLNEFLLLNTTRSVGKCVFLKCLSTTRQNWFCELSQNIWENPILKKILRRRFFWTNIPKSGVFFGRASPEKNVGFGAFWPTKLVHFGAEKTFRKFLRSFSHSPSLNPPLTAKKRVSAQTSE